ncbi:MAG: hypothetical protein H7A35_05490 [Planctomycetales bacterium]|nr:hypothetical protein [bacterium]UNM09511.1 MAG: hypothetical protein H7A35_05490 [Planctomycetales bacterium]
MTALTESRYTRHREGTVTAHKVKGSTQIFKGGIVCADSTGHAVPGSDTAGQTFIGVAIEDADNSSGSDGDVNVRVMARGVFSFAKGGSITQADLGQPLYIVDDQTVAVVSTVTNDIQAGRLEGFDGTDVWLRIDLH